MKHTHRRIARWLAQRDCSISDPSILRVNLFPPRGHSGRFIRSMIVHSPITERRFVAARDDGGAARTAFQERLARGVMGHRRMVAQQALWTREAIYRVSGVSYDPKLAAQMQAALLAAGVTLVPSAGSQPS